MKKRTFLLAPFLILIGLSAYGLINWQIGIPYVPQVRVSKCSPPAATHGSSVEVSELVPEKPLLFYHLGSRFEPISKSQLSKATSAIDFLPSGHSPMVYTYNTVSVVLVENDQETAILETGQGISLNTKQLNFLRSIDYSKSFAVKVECYGPDSRTGLMVDNVYQPHYTVVPEKQASHELGVDGVLAYLRAQVAQAGIEYNISEMRPAQLYFTVSKDGSLKNFRLDRPSGNLEIDAVVESLLHEMPGKWMPAQNGSGDAVEQVLVLAFGIEGC